MRHEHHTVADEAALAGVADGLGGTDDLVERVERGADRRVGVGGSARMRIPHPKHRVAALLNVVYGAVRQGHRNRLTGSLDLVACQHQPHVAFTVIENRHPQLAGHRQALHRTLDELALAERSTRDGLDNLVDAIVLAFAAGQTVLAELAGDHLDP